MRSRNSNEKNTSRFDRYVRRTWTGKSKGNRERKNPLDKHRLSTFRNVEKQNDAPIDCVINLFTNVHIIGMMRGNIHRSSFKIDMNRRQFDFLTFQAHRQRVDTIQARARRQCVFLHFITIQRSRAVHLNNENITHWPEWVVEDVTHIHNKLLRIVYARR